MNLFLKSLVDGLFAQVESTTSSAFLKAAEQAANVSIDALIRCADAYEAIGRELLG